MHTQGTKWIENDKKQNPAKYAAARIAVAKMNEGIEYDLFANEWKKNHSISAPPSRSSWKANYR